MSGEILNRNYKEDLYKGMLTNELGGWLKIVLCALDLSETTKQSLRIVNEDRIDYDLIEQLVINIDHHCDDGAILIFVPGDPSAPHPGKIFIIKRSLPL